MDTAKLRRIALLKKPLLSLFAYEVSCRVRVEKTTLAYFTMKASWPDTVSQTFTPKNLVPPLLGWTQLILLDPFLIYNHTTGVVVLRENKTRDKSAPSVLNHFKARSLSFLSGSFQISPRHENRLPEGAASLLASCYKSSISRVLFRSRGDNHLSRHGSCLPAQATQPGRFRGPHHPFPIWSCSMWGLPKPASHLTAGALLPHLSTLA